MASAVLEGGPPMPAPNDPLSPSLLARATRIALVAPIVLVVLAAAACGESSARPGTCGNGILEPGEECESFELRGQTCDALGLSVGQLRCTAECKLDTSGCGGVCGDGVVQAGEACDGANLNGATCASIFGDGSEGTLGCASDCRSLLTDTCRGTAPQGAFTACVPGSSTCPAPTACVETASGAFCIEQCDLAQAGTCGADRYCEDVGGVGACASVPAAGMACTERSGCRDGGLSCIPTFSGKTGPIATCAPACPASEVGKGQGSCAAGASCVAVAGGPLDIQELTACTAATEAVDCDVAAGYRCSSVTIAGAAAMRCARPYGQCAPVTPLYRFDGSPATDAFLCDRTQPTRGPAKCGLVSTQPLVNPARVECVEHFTGVADIGVCVAFCDAAVIGTGSAAASGPDGSCGDGATCKAPAAAEYFIPQADVVIGCTDQDRSACAPQFDRCLDLGRGLECARAVKICVPN